MFGNGEQPCVALYDRDGIVLFESDNGELHYRLVERFMSPSLS